jgi:hypothetical protein
MIWTFPGDLRNMIDNSMPKNDSLFPTFVFSGSGACGNSHILEEIRKLIYDFLQILGHATVLPA